MTARIGVVVFPGSNCDRDTLRGVELGGGEAVELWHEQATIDSVSAVVLPGGFAYGDYLRAGVIARFSPVMRAVEAFAADGGLVLGICNGFQVLAEAGLVPGVLRRNTGLRFVSRQVHIVPEHLDSPFTRACPDRHALRMPIAHGEGAFYADTASLDELEASGQVLFRYTDAAGTPAVGEDDPANPNGSVRGIAGVRNAAGNVAGLMPHPERAAEAILGSDDGLLLLRSLAESAALASRAARPVEVATR